MKEVIAILFRPGAQATPLYPWRFVVPFCPHKRGGHMRLAEAEACAAAVLLTRSLRLRKARR